MVRSYFRYEHKASFGVIASHRSNALFTRSADLALAAALEDVAVWNLRQGVQVGTLRAAALTSGGAEVTAIAQSTDDQTAAVGYSDGTVRLFSLKTHELVVSLAGHKKEVGALAFSRDGSRLASGSRDTAVIVWDVIAETGLFRLRGHKDEVTALRFLSRANCLVTCSKDTLLKVWDLATQHCVQTCVGHRTEVWTFDVDPQERRLVSGASDDNMYVWRIHSDATAPAPPEGETRRAGDKGSAAVGVSENTSDGMGAAAAAPAPAPPAGETKVLELYGTVRRSTPGRCVQVRYSRDGRYLGCLGAGTQVELFLVCGAAAIEKKLKRRRKRRREKREKALRSGGDEAAGAGEDDEEEEKAQAGDELEQLTLLRSAHGTKVRSFDFAPRSGDSSTSLLLGMYNNTLELAHVSFEEDGSARSSKGGAVTSAGHRADIRAVALSSNDELLLSCSSGSAKVWNVANQEVIRTLELEGGTTALTGAFLPGNRHVVVGTKEGGLLIFELASGDLCDAQESAHEGAVWSVALRPDGRGLASASADQNVKFWMFDVKGTDGAKAAGDAAAAGAAGMRPCLVHTRTLKMTDDVLCVRYSHAKGADKLLLGVSLMDNTVKVFFEDTLKFFLSLYGHKLPVMGLDISSDDTLLVTASADKNVKLWGLDFGDCHCSLFAHADSVMAVAFVAQTHHFFTAGKDGLVKYWDGDSREQIMSLDLHRGEVWCVAVSTLGDFVVTGSHDRSVRVWERTGEQLFLEEEREKELESEFDKQAAAGEEDAAEGDAAVIAGQATDATVLASQRLQDALDMATHEKAVLAKWADEEAFAEIALEEEEAKARAKAKARHAHSDGAEPKPLVPKPQPNMMMLGRGPSAHVEYTLEAIKPDDLEQALITLPFSWVGPLLEFLADMLATGSAAVELATRCVSVLLRTYHDQIVANAMLKDTLDDLRIRMRVRLQVERDCAGFNLAGLKTLKRAMATQRQGDFGDDAMADAIGAAKKLRGTE